MKAVISTLLISTAAILIAGDFRVTEPGNVTVHEWGTFTSVGGEDGSAVDWDALGGKDDLPSFVNNFRYRGFKWRLTGTVRMETPVMYFYSPHELDASVKIGFHQGLITEWYPRAATDVFQKSGLGSERRLNQNWNGIDTSLKSLTGTIEWRNIKVQPDTSPALPVENAHSRYYAARETDAAPVAIGDQHEKFLFYRGVARFPVLLNARLSSDGKVVVQNRGTDPVPTVILFENRGGRIGYRNAGLLQDSVAIGAPSLDSSIASLCNDLETELTAQGCLPKRPMRWSKHGEIRGSRKARA